jgi:hypothetical protein
MFKEQKIRLIDAINLSQGISALLGLAREKERGIAIDFTLTHRFKRQLEKLSSVDKLTVEARQKVIESVSSKKKLDKMIEDNSTIEDALTKTQLENYKKLIAEEVNSEATISILSEDFRKYLPKGVVDSEYAEILSDVYEFLSVNFWNKEAE